MANRIDEKDAHPLSACLLCLYGQAYNDHVGRIRQQPAYKGDQSIECLVGLILVQTDDLLCAGVGQQYEIATAKIKDFLQFGKWSSLKEGFREYNCSRIRQLADHFFEVDVTTCLSTCGGRAG